MKVKTLNFVEAGKLYTFINHHKLEWLFLDDSLSQSEFAFLLFDSMDEDELAKLLGILFGKNFLKLPQAEIEKNLIPTLQHNKILSLLEYFGTGVV